MLLTRIYPQSENAGAAPTGIPNGNEQIKQVCLGGINLTTSSSSDKKTQNSNFKGDNENSATNGQKQKRCR